MAISAHEFVGHRAGQYARDNVGSNFVEEFEGVGG